MCNKIPHTQAKNDEGIKVKYSQSSHKNGTWSCLLNSKSIEISEDMEYS